MKKILLFIVAITFSVFVYASDIAIEIQGLPAKAQKNAEARLALDIDEYTAPVSHATVKQFSLQAVPEIKEAIKPFGFFKSKITSKVTQTSKTTWRVLFWIDAGPTLTLKKVFLDVSGPGKFNPQLREFLKRFPLKRNTTLQVDVYNKAKEDLLQTLFNQGYIHASYKKSDLRLNVPENSATIFWHLQTGERYYFGSFSFSKSHYSPKFLKSFVRLPADQPFSSETLYKLQEDLSASQYFKQVEMTPELSHSEIPQIPIDVKITDRSRQKYHASLGYGTYTGARTTLGADIGRITDTGQYMNAEIQLSSVLSGLAVKYFIPGKNPLTDTYSIGANIQRFLPKNGSSTARGLTGTSVKGWGDWQTTTGINYLNESFKVEDQAPHVSQAIYPSFMLSRTHADNLIFPKNGSKFSVQLQAADRRLFSRNSFFQTELKGKYIYSPTKHSRVIIRGDLGYTVVQDLNSLPLTLRYFAGGLGSVRGYSFSSIGPGRYLKVASAELQHRIYGNWHGAIFYDVGTASNNFNGSAYQGAGMGIIYASILGPMQLYLSQAESKKGKPLRIDFNLGSDF